MKERKRVCLKYIRTVVHSVACDTLRTANDLVSEERRKATERVATTGH